MNKSTVRDLQEEMNAMNEARKAIINANSVCSDFPKLKKSFTYRKSVAIKSSDIASL
jgi:hypothetical protein|tara:strand:- start:17051 stop:17221 length:171 start_codon:yes stop_codon:yes gene_type:complete